MDDGSRRGLAQVCREEKSWRSPLLSLLLLSLDFHNGPILMAGRLGFCRSVCHGLFRFLVVPILHLISPMGLEQI
jgi:hypothetical protein